MVASHFAFLYEQAFAVGFCHNARILLNLPIFLQEVIYNYPTIWNVL